MSLNFTPRFSDLDIIFSTSLIILLYPSILSGVVFCSRSLDTPSNKGSVGSIEYRSLFLPSASIRLPITIASPSLTNLFHTPCEALLVYLEDVNVFPLRANILAISLYISGANPNPLSKFLIYTWDTLGVDVCSSDIESSPALLIPFINTNSPLPVSFTE